MKSSVLPFIAGGLLVLGTILGVQLLATQPVMVQSVYPPTPTSAPSPSVPTLTPAPFDVKGIIDLASEQTATELRLIWATEEVSIQATHAMSIRDLKTQVADMESRVPTATPYPTPDPETLAAQHRELMVSPNLASTPEVAPTTQPPPEVP